MDAATLAWAQTTARYYFLRTSSNRRWMGCHLDDGVNSVLVECLRAEKRYEPGRASLKTFLELRIGGAVKDYYRSVQQQEGVSRLDHAQGINRREHVPIDCAHSLGVPPDTDQVDAALTIAKLLPVLTVQRAGAGGGLLLPGAVYAGDCTADAAAQIPGQSDDDGGGG
jgi:DNA-directed RNA polymerase specialized sigma subunit